MILHDLLMAASDAAAPTHQPAAKGDPTSSPSGFAGYRGAVPDNR